MSDSKHSLLIVDDDNFLLDMYSMKFSQSDLFTVDTALGSLPAYEKLKNGAQPDVLILDMVMPGMDGCEFLEKVRGEGMLSKTIVIVLSNRGEQSDIDRCTALGAAGYIVKASSTPSEVIKKVTEIVTQKHSS